MSELDSGRRQQWWKYSFFDLPESQVKETERLYGGTESIQTFMTK